MSRGLTDLGLQLERQAWSPELHKSWFCIHHGVIFKTECSKWLHAIKSFLIWQICDVRQSVCFSLLRRHLVVHAVNFLACKKFCPIIERRCLRRRLGLFQVFGLFTCAVQYKKLKPFSNISRCALVSLYSNWSQISKNFSFWTTFLGWTNQSREDARICILCRKKVNQHWTVLKKTWLDHCTNLKKNIIILIARPLQNKNE